MTIPPHLALEALLLVSLVAAYKDDQYYKDGKTNPNTKRKMYWADSSNVLEDLSGFSALYVKFHSCVWSEVSDGDEDVCGNDLSYEADDENDLWYLGSVACKRANVAFSLYGTLVGDEDHGCQKRHFINSFYTTGGVDDFVAALSDMGYGSFGNTDFSGVTSYCSLTSQVSFDDDSYDDAYGGLFSVYKGQNYHFLDGFSSQGLACSGKRFVRKTFNGAACDEHRATRVVNRLGDFNDAMFGTDCVQIYSSYDGEGENGLDFLYNSQSCSVHDATGRCPDPHGLKSRWSTSLDRAMTGFDLVQTGRNVRNAFSVAFILSGVLLLVLACDLCCGLSEFFFGKRRRTRYKTEWKSGSSTADRGSGRSRASAEMTSKSVQQKPRSKFFQRLFQRNEDKEEDVRKLKAKRHKSKKIMPDDGMRPDRNAIEWNIKNSAVHEGRTVRDLLYAESEDENVYATDNSAEGPMPASRIAGIPNEMHHTRRRDDDEMLDDSSDDLERKRQNRENIKRALGSYDSDGVTIDEIDVEEEYRKIQSREVIVAGREHRGGALSDSEMRPRKAKTSPDDARRAQSKSTGRAVSASRRPPSAEDIQYEGDREEVTRKRSKKKRSPIKQADETRRDMVLSTTDDAAAGVVVQDTIPDLSAPKSRDPAGDRFPDF